MFKLEYEKNGRTITLNRIFQTMWAACYYARELCNTANANVYVYNVKNRVYVAYYWAD